MVTNDAMPDADAAAPSLGEFWSAARSAISGLPDDVPLAWAFGATPEHADALLALVLDGTKTATASSLWDYEHTGEPLPYEGEFSVILDGRGEPRAVIVTTELRVMPFMEVDAEHAFLEGEGDRSLTAWRDIHERFWSTHSENPRGYAPGMPVLCERFRLVWAR